MTQILSNFSKQVIPTIMPTSGLMDTFNEWHFITPQEWIRHNCAFYVRQGWVEVCVIFGLQAETWVSKKDMVKYAGLYISTVMTSSSLSERDKVYIKQAVCNTMLYLWFMNFRANESTLFLSICGIWPLNTYHSSSVDSYFCSEQNSKFHLTETSFLFNPTFDKYYSIITNAVKSLHTTEHCASVNFSSLQIMNGTCNKDENYHPYDLQQTTWGHFNVNQAFLLHIESD